MHLEEVFMFKLIADSTCDLSFDIIETYSIGIAPLSITIDGITYQDRIDIDADTFFPELQSIKSTRRQQCLHQHCF